MRKTDAAATALFLVVSPPLVTAQAPPPATAFVNVTVLTMVDDRIRPRQTVLVRDGRIAGVGGSDEIQVPPDAAVIDGEGRFLVPGLTDAHVHLPTGMPWGPTRDDFGDAPIYLAYGVTTVVNLGGTPAQLEWRRRIESGEWLGPTIYSAGPFVNEPRVTTPEEVEQDIVAQARAGFDLVKFHELPNTTVGPSAPAYRRMIETARREGLPLVGHAPVNLGLDEMLAARQSVAHVGMLSNIHFLPVASNRLALFTTLGAFVVLIGVSASSFVQMLFRRRRSMTLGTTLALASFAALATALTYLPGGPLFDSTLLRVVFTALAVFVAGAAAVAIWRAVTSWRDLGPSAKPQVTGPRSPLSIKLRSLTLAAAAGVLAINFFAFWVPVSWRGSDAGIDRLARRVRDAGIFVQSTLIVYESLSAEGRAVLRTDPVLDALLPATRDAWRQFGRYAGGAPLFRLREFMQKIVGALHRHGVPIVAGTDAMGIPHVAPGSSLHHELQLLSGSGLSPYEVLRSATVVPAAFLGRTGEFGTIAPGQRADLLLVDANPLQDLTVLKRPAGVMVRGRWLPRQELDSMLKRLTNQE
jgi:hypothetical protein